MKKLSLLIVSILLVLTLCACSSSSHKHDYIETNKIEPTCSVEGSITYECKDEDCKHIYTKTLAAGHVWQASTCTSPKTCSRCNLTEGETVGHTYENNVCTVCKHEISLQLKLPEASNEEPFIIKNFKDSKEAEYSITEIEYSVSGSSDDNVTVVITLCGEKTFDGINGKNLNAIGKIAYKICDEDGYVIFSSTKDTMMLVEGDKFKNLKISLSGFNAEQKYTLEFFDYKY